MSPRDYEKLSQEELRTILDSPDSSEEQVRAAFREFVARESMMASIVFEACDLFESGRTPEAEQLVKSLPENLQVEAVNLVGFISAIRRLTQTLKATPGERVSSIQREISSLPHHAPITSDEDRRAADLLSNYMGARQLGIKVDPEAYIAACPDESKEELRELMQWSDLIRSVAPIIREQEEDLGPDDESGSEEMIH